MYCLFSHLTWKKEKLALKYSVKQNMHTIACLVWYRCVINHSPVNFYMFRLVRLSLIILVGELAYANQWGKNFINFLLKLGNLYLFSINFFKFFWPWSWVWFKMMLFHTSTGIYTSSFTNISLWTKTEFFNIIKHRWVPQVAVCLATSS